MEVLSELERILTLMKKRENECNTSMHTLMALETEVIIKIHRG